MSFIIYDLVMEHVPAKTIVTGKANRFLQVEVALS